MSDAWGTAADCASEIQMVHMVCLSRVSYGLRLQGF
jgi:hypothetical protein